ncbi:hypothetical protein B0H14DRAFT_2693508 [Mycena olivaceomarginata]|nr:hypothetical protein B0H14DRAFT_2693508 [Mycena olivaceomarginata]
MSLLDGIRAGRQLRKVGIQHDSSAPSLVDNVKLTDEYDAIFTPKTIQVPLTLAQGRLLLRAYEKLEHDRENIVSAAAAEYVARGGLTSSGPLVPEEAQLLEELGARVQAAIDELAPGDGATGCFMKLSSRSPKDAAARSGVFESYYARAVRDEHGKLRELDDEQKLWILYESEGAALRFRDAASVFRALVLSERVWQDMTLAMRHPETWRQNVILRKWEPVPIDMEFRTFVSNGRLTAISQYAYQLYSPRLNDAAQLQLAIAAIRDLYNDLWPILAKTGFSSCVLDFGVIPPPPAAGGAWRATLIEINPFEETTDGALFRKSGGLEYPVVRITETRRTGALAMVPKGWKEVMAKVERTF